MFTPVNPLHKLQHLSLSSLHFMTLLNETGFLLTLRVKVKQEVQVRGFWWVEPMKASDLALKAETG